MRGRFDLQLTPQTINRCLKLIGFLEAAGGRKFWRGSDPCQPHMTREPGMRLVRIGHAINPRQTSDSRCRFLLAPSRRRPLLRPPRVAQDTEELVMLNGESKTHMDSNMWTGAHVGSMCGTSPGRLNQTQQETDSYGGPFNPFIRQLWY